MVVYLGKISYGIYMLHPVLLVLLLNAYRNTSLAGARGQVVLVLASSAFTFLIAALVYELYERPFLKWKERTDH
jgi:peptidoglycan/LPS O-acetylase OafA/YrhL